MITLGQASNYSFGRMLRHTLAWGGKKDSLNLKKTLAQRYKVKDSQVALYHTGRSALAVALQSVAQGQKMAVIVPGLTCIAVVRAIRAAGHEPVFVDIKRDNLEYDYAELERKLGEISGKRAKNGSQAIDEPQNVDKAMDGTRNTSKSINKAQNSAEPIDKNNDVCYNGIIILVQNTLGITWNVQKLEQIAEKYQAKIVEDLAHSAGRFYQDGREAGTVGQAAALSFGKGKAIDTISGGAVIMRAEGQAQQPARKPKLSDRLRDRWYPFFGQTARWTWRIGLGKIWMGALVKLHFVQRSADAELDTERRLTHWQAKLALKQLNNLPKQKLRDYRLVRDREKILQKLKQNGYDLTEIWYDTPVSPKRYAKEADFPSSECPETVRIAQEIINFPTWYPASKMTTAYKITEEYESK